MTSSVSGRYSGLSRVVPGRRFGAQPLVPSAVFSQRQAYTSLRPAKRVRYRPTLACKLDS
jgi:hypothetical protein